MNQIDEFTRQVLEENFILTDHVMEGGFGTIIKAFDRRNETPLAIKILKRKVLSGHEEREIEEAKLIHEAALAGRLVHPGIVRVLGVETKPFSYLLTEWIEGSTWWEKPPTRNLSLIVDLLIETGEAVAFAHRFGIVHFDLSPRNIMTDELGRVRIIDFGFASRLGKDAGRFGGTRCFIAPERLKGEVGDRRSDVYSFGALGFWLITGITPSEIQADNMTLLARRPEVSDEFIHIITQCLAENPEDRPSSLGELVLILRNAYPRLINITASGDEATKLPTSPLWRVLRYLAARVAILITILLAIELFSEIVDRINIDDPEFHEKLCLLWRHAKSLPDTKQLYLLLAGLLVISLIIRVIQECKFQYNVKAASSLLELGDRHRAMVKCRKAANWRKSRIVIRIYARVCAAQGRCDRFARSVYEQAFDQNTATAEVAEMLAIIYGNMPSTEELPPEHILKQVCPQQNDIFIKMSPFPKEIGFAGEEKIQYEEEAYQLHEERVIEATQTLIAEYKYPDVFKAKENQIIKKRSTNCKDSSVFAQDESFSEKKCGNNKSDKDALRLLKMLRTHFDKANNSIRDDIYINPGCFYSFAGFAFIMLLARYRIETDDTIIFSTINFILLFYFGCFLFLFTEAFRKIGAIIDIWPVYCFKKHIWRNIGIHNRQLIKQLIRNMKVSVSEYKWAMNLSLPPEATWCFIVDNAIVACQKKKRLLASGLFIKYVLYDITVFIAFLSILLADIHKHVFPLSDKTITYIIELILYDSLIFIIATIMLIIKRGVWISREESVRKYLCTAIKHEGA